MQKVIFAAFRFSLANCYAANGKACGFTMETNDSEYQPNCSACHLRLLLPHVMLTHPSPLAMLSSALPPARALAVAFARRQSTIAPHL